MLNCTLFLSVTMAIQKKSKTAAYLFLHESFTIKIWISNFCHLNSSYREFFNFVTCNILSYNYSILKINYISCICTSKPI